MNSAEYVDRLIADLKDQGKVMSDIAWETALACVGWPYVFGAWGAYCTPAERRRRYRSDHPTIKTACQNFDGDGTCSGCKWFPDGKRVRCFDCRGFTDWVLKVACGFDLKGEGATSQWNTESNWAAKGSVSDGIPQGVIVCLFYRKKDNPKVMAHTGLYYNGETCECSSGVQHSRTLDKKWTDWAVPACVGGVIPDPGKPTLRKGDSGSYVTLAQTMLIQRGYALPKYGADGKFGNETLEAVKAFQKANGLEPDGVIGSATWSALENTEPTEYYTVTVPHVTYRQAEALCSQWTGASMKKE